MTQYAMPTILPDTHTGTDLSNFLNASYPALYSYHRGSSRPAYAVPGMIWIDSSVANVDSVRYFDGTHDILLHSFSTTTGEVIGGGPFTPGNVFYQGVIDPTVAAPASPRIGDLFMVTIAGAAHASFTGLSGTTMTVGDVIFYDGAAWQAIKLQSIVGAYLPLAGGTLAGAVNLSGASVSQPFTTILAANNFGRILAASSTSGGIQIEGLGASNVGLLLHGRAGIPNTSSSTSGAVNVVVSKHNGSGAAIPLAANENAFSVTNNGTVAFLVKAGGNVEITGALSVDEPIVADLQGNVDGTATSALSANVLSTPRTITIGGTGKPFDGSANVAFSLAEIGFNTGIANGTSSVTIPVASTNIIATTAGIQRLRIGADGKLSTGSVVTAPDVDSGGLVIDTTAAAAGNVGALSLKSAITHPFTTQSESNSYGLFTRAVAGSGGLRIRGITSGGFGLFFQAYAQAPPTSGAGVISMTAYASNGATSTAPLADNHIMYSVSNTGSIKFQIKGNGDVETTSGLRIGGAAAGGAYVDANALVIKASSAPSSAISVVSDTFTNPFTQYSANQMWALQSTTLANGGMAITAIATGANTPLGVLAVGDGTNPGILLNTMKHDGAGSITGIGADDIALMLSSGVNIFNVYGSGDIYSRRGFHQNPAILPVSTGETHNLNPGRTIITSGGTVAALTLNLPDSARTETEVYICADQAITSLTIASAYTVRHAPTTLGAGEVIAFQRIATTWYMILAA